MFSIIFNCFSASLPVCACVNDVVLLLFLSEALETINFQKLNPNDIKYLDGIQVSLICATAA